MVDGCIRRLRQGQVQAVYRRVLASAHVETEPRVRIPIDKARKRHVPPRRPHDFSCHLLDKIPGPLYGSGTRGQRVVDHKI